PTSTDRSSTKPSAAPALTAPAAQQPGPPPRNKRQRTRSTSQLLPPSSHVLKPRKTIQICTLLIITASLQPKRSRHSTATAQRRPGSWELRIRPQAGRRGDPHNRLAKQRLRQGTIS